MLTMTRIDGLAERAATELGTSDWVAVTQEAVDAFRCRDGRSPVDPHRPRTAADSPFGGTIARERRLPRLRAEVI